MGGNSVATPCSVPYGSGASVPSALQVFASQPVRATKTLRTKPAPEPSDSPNARGQIRMPGMGMVARRPEYLNTQRAAILTLVTSNSPPRTNVPPMDWSAYPSRKLRLVDPEAVDTADLTPADRLARVWPLTLRAWALKGLDHEPRLSRHVGRVIRRGR